MMEDAERKLAVFAVRLAQQVGGWADDGYLSESERPRRAALVALLEDMVIAIGGSK